MSRKNDQQPTVGSPYFPILLSHDTAKACEDLGLEDEIDHRQQLDAAQGYGELQMFAEAHAALDQAERDASLQMEVSVQRLDLFLAEQRWGDAAIYGEALNDLDPEELDFAMKWAFALHALGETDRAIYALSLLEGDSERDADYQYRLADYEAETGESEDALRHLKNAIALDPALRNSAAQNPRLAQLAAAVPADVSFIPAEPPYEPEPGELGELQAEIGGDLSPSDGTAPSPPAPFLDPFSGTDPVFEEDESDFDCPF